MPTNAQQNFTVPTKELPQVRFNKGYWDGCLMVARGLPQGQVASVVFYDSFYEDGMIHALANYERGDKADGRKAWDEYRATLTDPHMIFQLEACQP